MAVIDGDGVVGQGPLPLSDSDAAMVYGLPATQAVATAPGLMYVAVMLSSFWIPRIVPLRPAESSWPYVLLVLATLTVSGAGVMVNVVLAFAAKKWRCRQSWRSLGSSPHCSGRGPPGPQSPGHCY